MVRNRAETLLIWQALSMRKAGCYDSEHIIENFFGTSHYNSLHLPRVTDPMCNCTWSVGKTFAHLKRPPPLLQQHEWFKGQESKLKQGWTYFKGWTYFYINKEIIAKKSSCDLFRAPTYQVHRILVFWCSSLNQEGNKSGSVSLNATLI